jgi:hypothetical protein
MSLAIISTPIVPGKRVTSQPSALSMDLYSEYDEKHPHLPARTRNSCQTLSCSSQNCADCTDSPSQCHNECHKSRLHRLLIPAILSLVSIAAVISLSCLYDLSILGVLGPDDGILGVGKRALTSGTSNGGSTLVNNKCMLQVHCLAVSSLFSQGCSSVSHHHIRGSSRRDYSGDHAQCVVL